MYLTLSSLRSHAVFSHYTSIRYFTYRVDGLSIYSYIYSMELTKDNTQTYLWIGKCIHSCETHDQLNNALNLVNNYKTRLQSQVRRGELPSGTLALIYGLNKVWDHQENIINANEYGVDSHS